MFTSISMDKHGMHMCRHLCTSIHMYKWQAYMHKNTIIKHSRHMYGHMYRPTEAAVCPPSTLQPQGREGKAVDVCESLLSRGALRIPGMVSESPQEPLSSWGQQRREQ